jgi:hypothetical protein
MDRVARIWHHDDIARGGDGLGEVGKTFLRAEGDDNLAFRIELDPESAGIIACTGSSQSGDAAGYGIPVRLRVLRGFDELGDDVRGRRTVGIAHPEINDIVSRSARAGLQRIDLVEDVWGKAFDPVKVLGHRGSE